MYLSMSVVAMPITVSQLETTQYNLSAYTDYQRSGYIEDGDHMYTTRSRRDRGCGPVLLPDTTRLASESTRANTKFCVVRSFNINVSVLPGLCDAKR